LFEQNAGMFEQNARMFEQKKWPGVKKEAGGTFFGDTRAKSKHTLTAKPGVKPSRVCRIPRTAYQPAEQNAVRRFRHTLPAILRRAD